LIHPTAIIDPSANIAADVTVGAYSVIGANVTIGAGCKIGPHVVIEGPTVIGEENEIYQFSSIGAAPQDKKYAGEPTELINIAHDCVVGNNTIFANNATLAGHVRVHDFAILGGFTLVHQFCRVGKYSFTGMGTSLGKDLPPYITAHGAPALPRGINSEGLKRNGFDATSISRIKQCYRMLYRQDLQFQQALLKMEETYPDSEEVELLNKFCKRSERGIIR